MSLTLEQIEREVKEGNYVELAKRTEAINIEQIGRVSKVDTLRLLHGGIGLTTEVGEIMEALEKEEIDIVNLKEEVGDLMWYIAILCDVFGMSFKYGGAVESVDVEKDLLVHSRTMAKTVGVLMDVLKRHIYYGEDLNRKIFIIHIVQVIHCVKHFCKAIGTTTEEAQIKNISKLNSRYGDKFSLEATINRDLEREREILEQEKDTKI